MAKKKSDQPEQSAEQRELERRVDAMMSVEREKVASPVASGSSSAKKPPNDKPTDDQSDDKPVKVLKIPDTIPDTGQPSAPPLPAKLLKAIGADKEADKAGSQPDPAPAKTVDKPVSDDELAPELPQPEDLIEPSSNDELPDTLGDGETNKAVDDIVASEANTQLAVDDARARRRTAEAEAKNQRSMLAVLFTSPWTWLIIIGSAAVAYVWYR